MDEAQKHFRYTSEKDPIRCSFCGRAQAEVAKVVAGAGVYICNDCIVLCFTILQEEAPDGDTFRLAVLRPDGTAEKVEIAHVSFSSGNRSTLRQCPGCGTWLAGEGVTACLHCGAALP